MLGDNLIKEQISYAYLHLISSKCGFTCQPDNVDVDSVDATIKCPGKVSDESLLLSPSLEVQLKATSNARFDDDNLIFDCPLKNYDKLRVETHIPRILVVLALNSDEDKWVYNDIEKLTVEHCCFWISLVGMDEVSNQTSVRIRIPKTNILNPLQLRRILERISKLDRVN